MQPSRNYYRERLARETSAHVIDPCSFCCCVCVQVKENVSKVFSKFVGEGKATIRFREPAHELALSKVS